MRGRRREGILKVCREDGRVRRVVAELDGGRGGDEAEEGGEVLPLM